MAQFILRYRGTEAPSPGDVEAIREHDRIRVLDYSSQRMLLIEGAEDDVRTLVDSMPGWIAVAEQSVPLPDTRLKAEHPPE
jgi:hypothetical protein